jgi:hypothetical protein
MKLKSLSVVTALALAVAASACTKSSPTRPTDSGSGASTASVTDAKTGITITTPVAASPTDGQRFKYADQPLTLTVKNAAATGSGALTYTFQVASDAGFATVVQTKDGVAEGSGQTSVKLDTLAGNKDYFWRARANSGGLAGPFSKGLTFNVGPQVVLQAPTVLSPTNGGQLSGTPPAVSFANASRTGPAGNIVYRVEISTSNSFSNPTGVATVTEGAGGQTSATLNVSLTPNATYFWHVRAEDTTNGIQGPYSPTSSFQYVPFDMRQARIFDNPPDVGSWDETAKITSVEFTGDAFLVDFDKRDGPGRWVDLDFGDGRGGTLQYTLGICANLSGGWACSAVVQFWYGRELAASTPPSYVGRNWFYDGRWGALNGYQPQNGETVGIWVGHGNLRGKSYTGASCPQICDRSNVQMVTWQNDDHALYTFSAGARRLGFVRR